jgi:hypothetical protein
LHSPAYLIIGVEDKTKNLVGVKGLTEEQLQQIVAAYCKPSIPFSYKIVDVAGAQIGVMQFFCSNLRPHMLKTRFDYTDSKGKQRELRESQIFIRHGSIVEEATREDLVAILEDRSSNEELLAQIAAHLEKMSTELPDVTYQLGEISSQSGENHLVDFPDRVIEGAFVSCMAGGLAGLLWETGWMVTPLLTIPLCLVVSIVGAALRIVHYDFWRAFFSSLVLGILLSVAMALLDTLIVGSASLNNPPIFSMLIIGSVFGVITGTIGSFLLLHLERRLR